VRVSKRAGATFPAQRPEDDTRENSNGVQMTSRLCQTTQLMVIGRIS